MKASTMKILAAAALGVAACGAAAQGGDLRGEQVVQQRCVKCHGPGLNGAPKIGDRDAWIPRLKQGIDPLVRSAIRGHGNMPARGGMAQFTDPEIRSAVLYMVNGREVAPPSVAPPPAAPDPYRKVVEETEIRIGIVPAESLRGRPEGAMHGGVPSGRSYFHVNVSLHDSKSGVEVKAAEVQARVASPLSGETKVMDAMTSGSATSYGNYFQMPGNEPYTVTIQFRLKKDSPQLQARFDVKR